jgi:hypothetical protein
MLNERRLYMAGLKDSKAKERWCKLSAALVDMMIL